MVIPLAPREESWKALVPQLILPEGSEILLATGQETPEIDGFPVKVVPGGAGRAQQMNAGAKAATSEILWFLHADSMLGEDALSKLQACLKRQADALYFFDLRFLKDGPPFMKLNEWAVLVRAGLFKVPFGDQGFCISRDMFFALGGYREDVAYGEDHLLVWKARQMGYPIRRTGADLFTSARKYGRNGWATTTVVHFWLTVKQAGPELGKLLLAKFFGRTG